jgi:hypothetical protein
MKNYKKYSKDLIQWIKEKHSKYSTCETCGYKSDCSEIIGCPEDSFNMDLLPKLEELTCNGCVRSFSCRNCLRSLKPDLYTMG